MNWPDLFTVALVLLLLLLGLRRGLWSELLQFLGVGLAIALSAWLTPRLSPHLPGDGTALGHVLRWLLLPLLALVLMGIFGALANRAEKELPEMLHPLDRLGGALVGAAKGTLFAGLLFFALLQFPAPQAWKAGSSEARFAPVALGIDAVVAEEIARHFPALVPVARSLGGALRRAHHAPAGTVVHLSPFFHQGDPAPFDHA